jgi:cytochrome c553
MVLFSLLACMLIRCVAAQSNVDWELFSSVQPGSSAQSSDRGWMAFQGACGVCHGTSDAPGTISLAAKYRGAVPALLERRTDLTPQFVLYYIRHGVAMMAPFRKTELNDTDAQAIAHYLARRRK